MAQITLTSSTTKEFTDNLNNNFTELYDNIDTLSNGKQDNLDATQTRKITYGTSTPTGGSDGDIYIQIES